MYELLKELCSLNVVSGNEEAVREYIRKQVEPYADSIHTDLLGNLIVSKRGERSGGRRVLLAAHMDEVGLIVTRITEKGYLKFSFVGGVDRRVALGKKRSICFSARMRRSSRTWTLFISTLAQRTKKRRRRW